MKFCSIFNSLSTTGWNIKKLTQCTHTHPELSNSTKSTAQGTIAWKLSTSQRNKQMETRGVSHCCLAIYIKKYLKAKEVCKLMLSPTSINEKITYVYIMKAKSSTPNLTNHGHPQVKLIARVSVAGVNGHHPAPNAFLHTARNMPKQSAHPQVGKTLKLCKNNYFEGT